jgi:hypothetical protein
VKETNDGLTRIPEIFLSRTCLGWLEGRKHDANFKKRSKMGPKQPQAGLADGSVL